MKIGSREALASGVGKGAKAKPVPAIEPGAWRSCESLEGAEGEPNSRLSVRAA